MRLNKILYARYDRDGETTWWISDIPSQYLAVPLNHNDNYFQKYIYVDGREINPPTHTFVSSSIVLIYFKEYSPNNIYKHKAIIFLREYYDFK